ncbi:conserved hypothetical protein, membrane [Beggiatoa sp. PS]|nr:conserved hypothetical protein, membrane [Beggiatoa sp. PS]
MPLLTLWSKFFDLCRLRLKPQDLPYSQAFLNMTLSVYAIISIVLSLIHTSIFDAILSTIIEIGLLIILISSLLYLVHYPTRIIQTLTALAGASCVLGILSFPVMYWFEFYRDYEITIPILLLFGLGVWNFTVYAHVLRHALAVPFFVGLLLTFIIFTINFSVLSQILPLTE